MYTRYLKLPGKAGKNPGSISEQECEWHGEGRAPFPKAMIFRDIESAMASQFKFTADARDNGLLIVTEERSARTDGLN